MQLQIRELLWKDRCAEHMELEHRVSPFEVIEAFETDRSGYGKTYGPS